MAMSIAIKNILQALKNLSSRIDEIPNPYPVGAIYLSLTNDDPADLFGGVWEKIEGRFLLASSSTYTLNSQGGEATHVLTTNEMPSHSHTFSGTAHTHTLNGHTHSFSDTTSSSGSHTHSFKATTSSNSHKHNVGMDFDGAGGSSRWTVHQRGTSGAEDTASTSNTSHTHTVSGTTGSGGSHTHTVSGTTGGSSANTSSTTAGGSISSTGGSAAHNNMPPYLAVNMWQRIE